ncbi:universal stress protein [Simplicispira psychrophila]|uniref:universal stress protein n=1 Tax=Simplicispira psychrophila TaxID=80882 RepID=UPI0004860794|nr:universal stress protein [Simplicispira psychrophila]
MNILLAVDGSAYTKKMLAYLATHDYLQGTAHQYTVITVQPALPARARAAVGKEVVNQYYADEADKVMGPVCKYLERHGVTAQRVAKVGSVGETIAKFADAEKFDMLVMGSRGHGALATLVMGSVTMQVLANSTVPVLIVR